jgi:hypothetical protein
MRSEARTLAPSLGKTALPALFLAAVFLVTRAPLIGHGYGTDPDAWRNAVAAFHMRLAGHYIPSRVPGFPVYETLLALLIPGGWMATNVAAALAQLAALIAFARVLELRGVARWGWPVAALALSAALWVHTTQTMDYAFGLAFFLGAYAALLANRFTIAGVMFALAMGCRATYALTVPPALIFLALREGRRSLIAFAIGFVPAAFAVVLPVWLSPEARDLTSHLARHAGRHVTAASLIPVLRGSVVFLIGKWAVAVLIVALCARAFQRGRSRFRALRRPHTDFAASVFEALSALAITGFFLLIPYEQAYLLPVLPIVLITLARRLTTAWMAAFAIAMAVPALLNFEIAQGRFTTGDLGVELAARRDLLAQSSAVLKIDAGRRIAFEVGRFGVHRVIALDRGLEVTAAGWSPFSAYGIAARSRDGMRAYAERLTPAESDSLRQLGFEIRSVAP